MVQVVAGNETWKKSETMCAAKASQTNTRQNPFTIDLRTAPSKSDLHQLQTETNQLDLLTPAQGS